MFEEWPPRPDTSLPRAETAGSAVGHGGRAWNCSCALWKSRGPARGRSVHPTARKLPFSPRPGRQLSDWPPVRQPSEAGGGKKPATGWAGRPDFGFEIGDFRAVVQRIKYAGGAKGSLVESFFWRRRGGGWLNRRKRSERRGAWRLAIGDSGQRGSLRVEGAGSGREGPISDLRLEISDLRFEISHLRLEISERSSKGFSTREGQKVHWICDFRFLTCDLMRKRAKGRQQARNRSSAPINAGTYVCNTFAKGEHGRFWKTFQESFRNLRF